MREQEVRNLWEAYLEVCENQQLDEVSDELVDRAVNKRIAATGAANDEEMRDRTPENMRASVRAGKKEASMKTAAAKRRKRINNEETDLFDTILEYLVSEGYADTNESALAIMANMSEEWRQSIVEMAYTVNVADVKGGTKAAKNAQAGMKDKSGNPMYNPGVGVGPDFKLKGV